VAFGLVTAPAATGQAPGERTRTTYEGKAGSRVYELFVPAALDPGPRPLVVYLHGCTQDAPDAATGTRFDELADERGFLVAYPEQDPDANGSLCWNWFRPEHQARGAGEPAIIAGIVEEISARFPVDAARVYVSASAGGVTCGAPPATAASSAQPAGDGTSGVGDDTTVPTPRTADPTRSLPATGSSSSNPLAVALGLALAGLIAARASRPLIPSVPTRRNAPCPDRPS